MNTPNIIKLKCPHCSQSLRVSTQMAGKKGKCPACRTTVRVPLPAKSRLKKPVAKKAAPSRVPAPILTFMLSEEGKKTHEWKGSVYKDKLTLFCHQTQTVHEIMQNQAADRIKTAKLLFFPPVMLIRTAKEKINFRLTTELFHAINHWIGKDVLLKSALKQRLGFCIPIGILYLLSSLPLPGDPEANLDALPFDPINAALGITLIILSIIMKIKPHPALFLVDSAWFMLLMAVTAYQIFLGASPFWWIAVAAQLFLVVTGVNQFIYFSKGNFNRQHHR
jgi:hypothetical protein